MARKACPNCGAVYELRQHKSIMRDIDSIECETPGCGATLISWNGGVFYSATLIEPGQAPNPSPPP